ncbi:hypothetical protein NON20_24200 (plasmid) [Synechocystis sp. B12]|nr:hypothetical protein NON20_24200 [Synechocystis sp. B12]
MFIFISLIGSILSVITNQITYFSIPIIPALILNLINRQRLEIKTHQAVNKLELIKQMESINLLLQDVLNKLEKSQDISAITTRFIGLETQCKKLQSTLDSLIYRMLSDGVLSRYQPQPEHDGIAKIILDYNEKASQSRDLYNDE